ncbi:hypothetical protein JKG68_27490 [Microvirga aerilata]|uniref:Peptide O-xylosyltransferase n=1 Tax=Microvirga aerilata TaxID=670292 RepID=A0A936ZBF5_9HYPH|nr:beta-1,6-N-acetylglucosaminyltransferase [Microvirga aerilata]MBL0407661.1 hypothetical protein [Microvirga aerilata]
MKIAYLVLAHARPKQLLRLIDRLDGPDISFHIHIDLSAGDTIFREAVCTLAKRTNVFFVERQKCNWGSMSLVEAELRCLKNAFDYIPRFDVAVLLSGADYPIKSRSAIQAFFERYSGQSIMHHWSLPSEKWANETGGLERYQFWNVKIGRSFLPILGPRRFSNTVIDYCWNAVATRFPIRRRFPIGLTPYGGSMWWALTRDCAKYVLDFIDENPNCTRFFSHVKIPDEMYLQSIIMSSRYGDRVLNQPLHFLSWQTFGAPSPRVLTQIDMPDLSSSPCMFARKFDIEIDGKVLDLVDEILL